MVSLKGVVRGCSIEGVGASNTACSREAAVEAVARLEVS